MVFVPLYTLVGKFGPWFVAEVWTLVSVYDVLSVDSRMDYRMCLDKAHHLTAWVIVRSVMIVGSL